MHENEQLTILPFLPPFLEKSGDNPVVLSVRKTVLAFSNVLEWDREANLGAQVLEKVVCMKNHQINTWRNRAKAAFLPPKHPCFTRIKPANIPDTKTINE
jgi:hypothetical protein